jgi:hypothetical protein
MPNDDEAVTVPLFSCCWQDKHDMFMHALAHHLLYNLGKTAFVGENRNYLSLDTCSVSHWLSFTDTKKVQNVMAKLTIRVLGGRIENR